MASHGTSRKCDLPKLKAANRLGCTSTFTLIWINEMVSQERA